ncbi:MAG: tRNA preQ1(34) S-adenosylmethionine ribosyltransferase-isomerase QueA [Candidatus Margulisbacteria bacterium]|jgi:S-adenosylmethionine:tRNA ribosyltransferase-isomerase|nr:tRNA preQ1(34) S-adenosylmethionine ribosyltransferase-isomerase QueA [Candidatus Margulisiibacteriota bacterium]
MKTSEFDFRVPDELIAHEPAIKRDQSRLMVLDRARQTIEHKHFFDLVDYLLPGDLLVVNDTKVIPANLVGRKADGSARVEVLLAKLIDPAKNIWECLVKPGKRLSVGSKVVFDGSDVVGTVLEKTASGEQIIQFQGDLDHYIHDHGEIPLPPYINSSLVPRPSSLIARYQTVYAQKEGASAAPTAGLHFTPELLAKAKAKGVGVAHVTLHTGLATFKPIYAENIEDHKMYSEHYDVSPETVEAVKKAKRIVAVGTTSVRTLETIASGLTTKTQRHEGDTKIYIYPGYDFQVVDAMVTNFHWPRTSLIMLVSAFAGKEFILRAYREAVEQKYRFFSFGDAMLIL